MARTLVHFLVACFICVTLHVHDVQAQGDRRPRPGNVCQTSGDTREDECERCICDADGMCYWEFDPSLPKCDVMDSQFPSEFPRGFGGGSCEDGEESRVLCIECICNSTGCTWTFNFETCGIPELPDAKVKCESGQTRPSPVCQTCLCDADGMCSWERDTALTDCADDCEGEDVVQCYVDPCRFAICPSSPNATCVSNYCGDCNAVFYDDNGGEIDCFDTASIDCPSGETPSECYRDPCSYTRCLAYPDATCVANYCDGCNAEFYDADRAEVQCFGEDDEDEDKCKPGARTPRDCRDCVCLNDDCGRCTGKERCEWYDNPRDCRGDDGDISCPGNRPFSPCGEDLDPCDLVGECTSNPDLECKKFECSMCQARFYNAEGFQEQCPVDMDMEQKVCSVPGRGRNIKVGVTIDEPGNPCQKCGCGADGELQCTDDRKCGKQKRFRFSLNVADCNSILNDEERREDFIDMLINTLAMKANISTANIKDVELSCGSIVIEAYVIEMLANEDPVDVDAAVNLFGEEVSNGGLVIEFDGEMYEPNADSFSETEGKASTLGKNVVVLTILAVVAAIWI